MRVERTIYVLDDDEAVLRSLGRLLSSANFEPVTFERADQFLAAAKGFKPGCVLLDVRLPGMDGLEVMAQIGSDTERLVGHYSYRPRRRPNGIPGDESGRQRFPGKAIQRS
jgi:FixJ family two-component response regulator